MESEQAGGPRLTDRACRRGYWRATVYSISLTERFTDLDGILGSNLPFLAPGGTLLIPNLRGVDRRYQKVLDRRNCATHHRVGMDPWGLGEGSDAP